MEFSYFQSRSSFFQAVPEQMIRIMNLIFHAVLSKLPNSKALDIFGIYDERVFFLRMYLLL
jgi:hypothetical protein